MLISKKLTILCLFTAIILCSCGDKSVNNGDDIKTITIDSMTWMLSNLDVSTYSNGESIPEVKDSLQWSKLTTGAWCYYNNDPATGKTYGKLYNWFAVNDKRGLAPKGWHIASDEEWTKLSAYFGTDTISAGKLKEKDTLHWASPNIAGNESGFTALPGGYRLGLGGFYSLGVTGHFWTSTEYNELGAWLRYMIHRDERIRRFYADKFNGNSVRCVKD